MLQASAKALLSPSTPLVIFYKTPKLESVAIKRERDVILREQLDEVVLHHLHAVASQGQPFTILGLKTTNGVDRQCLVKLAEKHFCSFPVSANSLALSRLHVL